MALAKISKKGTKESVVVRVPPQSIDAEIGVLGSLLIDKDSVVKIAEIFDP